MRRSRIVLLAMVLTATPASPGGATPGPQDLFYGQTCSVATVSDMTGLVIGDSYHRVGEVDSGPWVILHPDVNWLDIRCTVQLGTPEYSAPEPETFSTTVQSNVGVLVGILEVTAAPGMPIYACTTLSWYRPGVFQTWGDDVDPHRPGRQCPLVAIAGPDPFRLSRVS